MFVPGLGAIAIGYPAARIAITAIRIVYRANRYIKTGRGGTMVASRRATGLAMRMWVGRGAARKRSGHQAVMYRGKSGRNARAGKKAGVQKIVFGKNYVRHGLHVYPKKGRK